MTAKEVKIDQFEMDRRVARGKRLRLARSINKLKIDEVCDLVGFTKAALSRYENGLREPRIDALKKLATVYNIPINFLIDGTFLAYPQPGLLVQAGGRIEVSKEEYEMSHKLLIETVKQVVCEKIEKLGHEELIGLLDIDEERLRVLEI
ncbi:helix-turn-helix domain-containing protein [Niallia taxi]|uniref:helix-turn-helix domain-containing protein n=1 Tax=Niallia taxi TaxID=2499688 RepID=UPI0015F6B1BD|nr:helix-turn-helix transcriptional regulator [Niallia taxi]